MDLEVRSSSSIRRCPNDSGQNWSASAQSDGTPGRANSNVTNDIPPLILEAKHFPAVPRSTDPVAVSARIIDEATNGVQSVTLFYRNHTSSGTTTAFTNIAMFDDGCSQ